jgi:hypothetical protein
MNVKQKIKKYEKIIKKRVQETFLPEFEIQPSTIVSDMRKEI